MPNQRPFVNEELLLKRYVQGDEKTWHDVASRVANHASKHGSEYDFERYYDLIHGGKFFPSRMTYMGTGHAFASSCFVFPVEDSLTGIMKTLNDACQVQKYGGGTGYNFSHLRPKGDLISTSGGDASGPVSFMGLFHNAMEVVHRAGKKHAAQMGILNCDHPDIFEFIHCKDQEGAYWTFNISVAVTDKFMDAVEGNLSWDLQFKGKVYKTIPARELWDAIVTHAWGNGDPGIIFLDTVNRFNRYPEPIEACNPCGEQMLPPYVSCNLGSIDLSRFVIEKKIDWQSLDNAVRGAVSFLDDSLDSAFWPVEEVQVKTAKYRNIGLGVMGWSDMCIMLGFAYDSNDAVELGDEVMCFINSVADDESMLRGGGNRKNVTVTSIAPTGSISMLAGCSSGIEPLFGIVTTKNTYVGSFHNVHWLFEKIAKERGFYSDELIKIVAERGSVQGLSDVPTDVQELFKTTTEIDWEWHVKHQAAFQKHTDNAVSKCLARGTLIQTSQGLVAIESFSNNNSPDSFSPVSGLLTSMGEPITQHYYAGSKPATRVRLNNGAEIVGSTESHRILTLDGWKRLSDMQVGDMVVGKFIESHGIGGMPIQWKDDFRSNANRVATPKQMTIDLAKFLGMLAADGNFTESTGAVNLTHKNQAVEREYIRLCQNLFGLTPRRTVDKRNDVVSLTISSRNLVRYTHFLIGFDAFTKKVPTQILMGSAEEKLAFVSGLTLDGYITRGVLCVYEGRSKELAYQVFEICNSFGLPKVNMRRKAVHGYGGHVYAVSVSNKLQEMIDPIEVHKRGSANVKYLVAAPSVAVDSAKVGVHHDAYYNWRSLNQRQPGCCWNTVADQLGIESKTPVYKVVSLEDAGMVEMYDVEVEGSHSYITNGIVSHNTINMASNAMVFDVSAAYMTAYDAGCKSITVYRDGSRQVQVMDNKAGARDMCPNCKAILFMKDGEKVCVTCGYKKTSLDEKTSLISEAKRARPAHLNGTTYRKDTPIGKAYVTVNTDAHGEPFEVFMNVGKAGSEVAAVSEGLGRLISLVLRMPSSVTPVERLRWIVDEISDIGGGRPMGFGAKRVRSLPDGIAQVLSEHLSGGNGTVDESPVASTKSLGDICPECGEATLLNVEGCRKCQSCGYSEC